jgi:hypothetical protein
MALQDTHPKIERTHPLVQAVLLAFGVVLSGAVVLYLIGPI